MTKNEHKDLAKAVEIANAIQGAIPPGSTTGIVLLALSLVAGIGIATNPDPEVRNDAIDSLTTTIRAVLNGQIILNVGMEH